MKPPIKAIKKIIKFCDTKDLHKCNECEIVDFCRVNFYGIPAKWKGDYEWLKKEVEKYE